MFRFALVLAILATSSTASAQTIEAYAGGEFWDADEMMGHGIVMVRGTYRTKNQTFIAELNTDTLTLRGEHSTPRWTFGLQARGELLIAGLLSDHFVGGINVPERTFYASYIEGKVDAKTNFGDHWIYGSSGARQWFFGRTDSTANSLVLPADALVLEQRLNWTYWKLASDPSWYEAHRVARKRIRGFAAGLELGLDIRNDARTWGAPEDPRNLPEELILTARQWAAFGIDFTPIARLQLRQWSGIGGGEDDLTRTRLGGMNAYVIPIPGLPWAGFLASTYVAGEFSQTFRIGRDLELGYTGNAALIEDPNRRGDFDQIGTLIGTSLFVDWRHKSWQFNASIGASPDTGPLDADLIIAAYLDVGTSF